MNTVIPTCREGVWSTDTESQRNTRLLRVVKLAKVVFLERPRVQLQLSGGE